MACIETRPNCAASAPEAEVPPLKDIAAVVGIASLLIGVIGKVKAAAGVVLGVAAGGMLAGFVIGVGILVIAAAFLMDRCNDVDGDEECVAGVVNNIESAFNSLVDELLIYTATHDRVDVVVHSGYWPVVEANGAGAICTAEDVPRKSEIMRSYYYTDKVCSALRGAVIGAAVGAIVATAVAGAIAAAACATVILCVLGLVLAVLAAAAITQAGATIGGQIGKEMGDDSAPSDQSGNALVLGDIVTVRGNMLKREHDMNANVFWWVSSTAMSGRMQDSVPSNPYSYCEVNDVAQMDACDRPVVQ